MKHAIQLAILLFCGIGVMGSAMTATDEELASQARAILEDRLGANADIQTRSVSRVTWSDASLGCPQPDRMYTQVVMEGYRIVLAANGQEYVFHGGNGNAPFLCDNPRMPIERR